jgi:hypothetical protein
MVIQRSLVSPRLIPKPIATGSDLSRGVFPGESSCRRTLTTVDRQRVPT